MNHTLLVGMEVNTVCYISEIPISVLHEIFFKLPIKSVIRCKSVCKSWHSLVSQPYFSINYAKNSNLTPLLYFPSNTTPSESYLLEISDNGGCIRTPFEPKLPDWYGTNSVYDVVGSCNGFICLLAFSRKFDDFMYNRRETEPRSEVICVSNPIIGDCITLPERKTFPNDFHFVQYCFGYCPFKEVFKVMRIVSGPVSVQEIFSCDYRIVESEIFTVGIDDTWRRFSFPFMNFHYCNVIAFEGAIHWIPWGEQTAFISTFGFADEKSGQILAPPHLVLGYPQHELVVCDDKLNLIDYSDDSNITIWAMKEYPLAESWTKTVILRSWLPLDVQLYNFRPVAELRDGEILFSNSPKNKLFVANTKQEKCSEIDIFAVQRIWTINIKAYAPKFHPHVG